MKKIIMLVLLFSIAGMVAGEKEQVRQRLQNELKRIEDESVSNNMARHKALKRTEIVQRLERLENRCSRYRLGRGAHSSPTEYEWGCINACTELQNLEACGGYSIDKEYQKIALPFDIKSNGFYVEKYLVMEMIDVLGKSSLSDSTRDLLMNNVLAWKNYTSLDRGASRVMDEIVVRKKLRNLVNNELYPYDPDSIVERIEDVAKYE